jgi:hypothetical protein
MAIFFSALSVCMIVLGIVEWVTNFRWSAGDQNTFFGNPRLVLNDGKVVIILSAFLILVSLVLWVAAARKDQGNQR